MTKKALANGMRKLRSGEYTDGPEPIYNESTLINTTVPQMRKLLKDRNYRFPTAMSRLKRADLIEILESFNHPDEQTRKSLPQDVEDFLTNGGIIENGRPQRNGRVKPPTQQSSYPVIRDKSKPRVKAPVKTRTNQPENTITLQQLIMDFGLKGARVRKVLRQSDVVKPGKQWVWSTVDDKKEIEKVKQLLMDLATFDLESPNL